MRGNYQEAKRWGESFLMLSLDIWINRKHDKELCQAVMLLHLQIYDQWVGQILSSQVKSRWRCAWDSERRQNYKIKTERQRGGTGETKSKKKDEKKSNNTRLSLWNCLVAMPIYIWIKSCLCWMLGGPWHYQSPVGKFCSCLVYFSHPVMQYRSFQGLEINISVLPQETLQLANNWNCVITI